MAGLLQLHQRCPYNEDSWADEKPAKGEQMAVAGQVDNMADLEDDDAFDVAYETEQFIEEGV